MITHFTRGETEGKWLSCANGAVTALLRQHQFPQSLVGRENAASAAQKAFDIARSVEGVPVALSRGRCHVGKTERQKP